MKLSQDVLDVLAAAETDGPLLRITRQLDRKLYTAVNRALEAAGGTWKRGKKAHLFDGDAAAIVRQLLATGEVMTGADAQFFPTPPEVVDELIDLADLEPEMEALEPSAGRGAIAERLWPYVDSVDCIEQHWKYAEAIEQGDYARNLWVEDFLLLGPRPVYDRVIMNPPFTNGQDIAHVQHAVGWLRPGGMVVSVMAAGVTFREDRKAREFRDLVDRAGGGIEPLPDLSFKVSGTDVRTVVAVIPRPARFEAVTR